VGWEVSPFPCILAPYSPDDPSRTPGPLVDRSRWVILAFAGVPAGDETWPATQLCATDLLESARSKLSLQKADQSHRRGNFTALAIGISHGGGQTHPRILTQAKENDSIVDELIQEEPFVQMSGFATGKFAAPVLSCLNMLLTQLSNRRIFNLEPSSPWLPKQIPPRFNWSRQEDSSRKNSPLPRRKGVAPELASHPMGCRSHQFRPSHRLFQTCRLQ